MKSILAFCLIGLVAGSCTITDHISPSSTDTCKLIQFVKGDEINDLTYDAAGNLTQWVITADLQGGRKFTVTYAYTRDAGGRISTRLQTIAIDGQIQGKPSTTQYTYTNGLLTGTNTVYELTDLTRVINSTFTYDGNQRIIKRVSTETGLTATYTYEYDSRGNCTRYVLSDTDGYKSEQVFTYDTSKNPEQLLAKSIPINPLTNLPLSVNVAVTTQVTYDDGSGPVGYSSKKTNVKTNAKGYVISTTETYDDGYVAENAYTLADCN